MAKKRKSRTVEAPQEPDVAAVQPTEPEPERPEPEEDKQSTLEQNPEPAQNDVAIEEEEPEEEEEEEEHKAEQVSIEGMVKPINEAVSENGSGGDELELEEEEEEEPLEKLLEPFSKDHLALIIREAVTKHPDVIESVHRLADGDPAHCKIFVHGLGWDASVETITSVFGQYGEIEDCKVVKDKKTGKSKGYGFILYKQRSGARRALKQPQKLIEGRMASCQLASAGPVQAPSPAVVGSVSTPPASEYTQRKIYVSNVSAEIDPRKLLEFFADFGEIEEGPLGLDKLTGKPRGFCLFVYRSADSARKALEEPQKNFEGQVLHCQKAVDGPKYTKGLLSQQQQQQQQGYQHHAAKKGRYAGGVGHSGGHLMAPSAAAAAPHMPPAGFNPAVAPAALGQAVAALLATQGMGLGIGNLLGGMDASVNPQGVPPMMSNVGYGGQGGYGGQPGMQGGYGGRPQMGQGGVRPHQGGAPYMGHGH